MIDNLNFIGSLVRQEKLDGFANWLVYLGIY